MITGRLAQIHFSTIRRCVLGITSAGSSTPRSPRATMMPYEASMISSILSSPSWFSIFEMILMLLPWASRISCTARMSRAERTNECAMKSTSFFTAHSMKRRSFSVTDGRSIDTPGTLTLLRERMAPPTTNSQSSSVSFLPTTRISSSPSAISIRAPTGMSLTIDGTFM